MAGLPNLDAIWGPKNWEQPTTLPQAKKMLGKLRSSKTRLTRHADSFPKDQVNKDLLLAHIDWNAMDQEMLDDVIGCANATHVCLLHNPGWWMD